MRQFSDVLVEFLVARDRVDGIKREHPEAYDLRGGFDAFDKLDELTDELNAFFTDKGNKS